jgi:flavin reductase (DIM6/NTAB) family NADH-FMN oxidoreductase RutF
MHDGIFAKLQGHLHPALETYMTATVTYLHNPLETQLTHPDQLKSAMRNFAGGVSVITAGSGDQRNGATVTSATALSMDPASMLISINRSSSIWPVISRFNHFCVNILSAQQQDIASRFAGVGGLKGVQRYSNASWSTLESGAAVLEGALASIDCAVEDVIERHTHAIVIGRVVALVTGQGEPLVYHNGHYGNIVPI